MSKLPGNGCEKSRLISAMMEDNWLLRVFNQLKWSKISIIISGTCVERVKEEIVSDSI